MYNDKNLPKNVKICDNIYLLSSKFAGITVWPFKIYIRRDSVNDLDTMVNHEQIHWQQQKELPILFYIYYGIEWLIRVIKSLFVKSRPYRDIVFEREAYDNQYDQTYLKKRKPYNWIKYYKNNRIK